MTVKLNKGKRTSVYVHDMEDGQIGQIVEWSGVATPTPYDIGAEDVVQRVGKILIVVGKGGDYMWSDILTIPYRPKDCRVRILQPGETIEIVENGKEE